MLGIPTNNGHVPSFTLPAPAVVETMVAFAEALLLWRCLGVHRGCPSDENLRPKRESTLKSWNSIYSMPIFLESTWLFHWYMFCLKINYPWNPTVDHDVPFWKCKKNGMSLMSPILRHTKLFSNKTKSCWWHTPVHSTCPHYGWSYLGFGLQ